MTNKDSKSGAASKGVIDQFWNWLTMIVGYPFAAVIIMTSPRSRKGFREDMCGESGRAVAREWGESIVVALFLALLIRSYLFQPFRIPSGSMRMTLIEGDRLFVNKLVYGPSLIPVELRSFSSADAVPQGGSGWAKFLRTRVPGFSKPQRGDVIVFRYPVTRDKDFIKRLIAFGGETVEIRDGQVLINDQPVTQGAIAKIAYLNRGDYGEAGKKIRVPEGYYFVMGDNTASSHDSRYWGFVPGHFVIGKADVIFWPPNRIKWIR